MSVFGSKHSTGHSASRSGLIIGLLIATGLLVLALTWQAVRSMNSHAETANRVLQDYAQLVASEYSRRAMGAIGFYGYYTYITWLKDQPTDTATELFNSKPQTDSPQERASSIAEYLFLIDPETGSVVSSREDDLPPEVSGSLRGRARALTGETLPDAGFVIDQQVMDDQNQIFVLAKTAQSEKILGFEVDRSQLAQRLANVFDSETLLPPSLARGVITNDDIYLQITDPLGVPLFESRERYTYALPGSVILGDDYEGIFRDYEVTAMIDPELAGALVIGGLPRSRLAGLVLLVMLAAGLLVTAIIQLRREANLMKVRDRFVSEVSHELRTPMTQILMFTETLLQRRYTAADDQHRALKIIRRESQRLINLVENVLAFSAQRSTPRILNREARKLAPIIENVVNEFRPLANATGADLLVDLDPSATARVDQHALRQILLNLLDNAIKYGPTEQTIQVNCTVDHEVIRIIISDQGPGVPQGERQRIWRAYYRQAREQKSAIAGTGIGLSVVRDLVNRQDGQSWVEDAPDGGARFVLEFPRVAGRSP